MAYQLVYEFHRIVKDCLAERMDCWLKAARESTIPAMQNVDAGSEKDRAAVVGAIALNGATARWRVR